MEASARAGDDRAKKIDRDRYYMGIAKAVTAKANCYGSKVGAVLVLRNRVISTGYNGTPEGYPNCEDGGCVRCKERQEKPETKGSGLDRCICVHAEQNALLTAARFGISVEGATLYTLLSPCFGCLKESVQAGVSRIVFRDLYVTGYPEALQAQYDSLADHLSRGEATNFEPLGGEEPAATDHEGQPDPYADLRDSLSRKLP